MRYEEFKAVWDEALRESAFLSPSSGKETLDLSTLDRRHETYVEPMGGQVVAPFHVTAKLVWRWDALATARTRTTEEDMLSWVFDREDVRLPDTERPWLRVDITLSATLPYGKPIPMPPTPVWARWVREAMGRMERIEPIVPREQVREREDGRLEILAWRGEPVVLATCGADGKLKVEAVELSAWQAIELPRQWDDPRRPQDEHPGRQLGQMFRRVRAALMGWMEVMDHLV